MNSKLKSPTTDANKDSSSSRPNSKTTPTRKRLKVDENHPKITSWLNQENIKGKRPKIESLKKFHALNISVNPSSSKNYTDNEVSEKKNKKSSKSLKRTSSFEKYGVVVPSFEKILADQRQFEQYRQSVKQLDVFDEGILHRKVVTECLEESKFKGELLDCKHLTCDDLTAQFQKHSNTLRQIKEEKMSSERHQLYKTSNATDVLNSNGLQCSTSMAVFKYEQIEHLLSLLTLEFDPEDKLTTYFFKVLLPELCLFIFMDVHQMKRKKAVAYLDERPLDL